MCSIFGLGALATLALIYAGGRVAEFSAVKLFKLGLAWVKATSLWQRFFPTPPPAA